MCEREDERGDERVYERVRWDSVLLIGCVDMTERKCAVQASGVDGVLLLGRALK